MKPEYYQIWPPLPDDEQHTIWLTTGLDCILYLYDKGILRSWN